MIAYQDFLARKAIRAPERGLTHCPSLAGHLFPFQAHCVEHALRCGSAGNFLDTGLGKTEVQLEWCQHALEASNGKALVLTPLAVAGQFQRRAERWGYESRVIREQSEAKSGINICNYDRLDKLEPEAFGAVSLDEASILKSFGGKTATALIDRFRNHRFRLAATATPAPNDHMELGNYAYFLSVMAPNEMLSRFFINDTSTASQQWRLKGHAVDAFWQWVASWARAAERPSDLGDSDEGFILEPFKVLRHRARDSQIENALADLFGTVTMSATTMYDIKRQTTLARAEVAAAIVFRSIDAWKESLRLSGTEQSPTQESEQTTPPGENIAKWPDNPTRKSKQLRSKKPTSNSGTLLESDGQTIKPCSTIKTGDVPSAAQKAPEATENSTSIIATKPAESGGFSATIAIPESVISTTTRTIYVEPRTTSTGATIPSWVLWCDTNEEQKTLENVLGDLCLSITGSQTSDEKERIHEAWLARVRPVLITKPSMFGFGCDWQHCHNMIFVGRSYSYETWYQAVRRCWRFGQKRQVHVHLVVAEGEGEIGRVIDRKSGDHLKMKLAMREAMKGETAHAERMTAYEAKHIARLPTWIRSAA